MKTQNLEGQQHPENKFPSTQVISLLNDQLIIILRLWSGSDIQQKVIEEISHFLSAASADLEVTTPFNFLESLSSIANKVRISMLLANDLILKTENKEKYIHGCEIVILYKHQQELSWGSLGRFSLTALKNQRRMKLSHGGTFIDEFILMPTQLLGIESEPNLSVGSISTKGLESITVESEFNDKEVYWKIEVVDFSS